MRRQSNNRRSKSLPPQKRSAFMCQRLIARFCAAVLIVAACAGATPTEAAAVERWQVVLVAGDTAQPVFDNAVKAVDMWLVEHGVARRDIRPRAAGSSPGDPAS